MLDLLTADIKRTHYDIREYEAEVDVRSRGSPAWSCRAELMVLAAQMPVDFMKVWDGIEEFFARRGLEVCMEEQIIKQRHELYGNHRVVTGSDLTFKVVFKPDWDLTVSNLHD